MLHINLLGDTGYLNLVAVSPDGSICASGGRDGAANLWYLNEGKRLYSVVAGEHRLACKITLFHRAQSGRRSPAQNLERIVLRV